MSQVFGKGSFLDKGFRAIDPMAGARASERAAGAATGLQERGLDYLIESNQLPMKFRDQALPLLFEYFTGGGQQLIDQTAQSPLYQNLVQQGEQSVLRNAATTGGLRSGNAQQALANNSQNILNGLVNQNVQGLQGFANLPSNANAVANQFNQLGSTTAQGIIGAEQSRQAGIGNLINTGATLASLFSDENLKDNITKIGENQGIDLYYWEWNKKANEIGLYGNSIGVIAQRIPEQFTYRDEETGYLKVNYGDLFNG